MPMKIKDVVVSDEDLNQRFKDTFIEVSVRGTPPEIVKFRTAGENHISLYTKDLLYKCSDVHIIREFPSLGAIQFEDHVHFVQRLPERQWARGFREKVLYDFTRSPRTRYSKIITQDMAKSAFYPQFQGLELGMKQIYGGDVASFAYNRDFWFSGFKKRVYLWFKDVPVGEINSSTLFCFPQCQHLKQEVKDEFKKGLQVK